MKYFNKFWLTAIALSVLASCVEESMLDFPVGKPESLARLEYLTDYDVLKSYVDRSANPNFKLGAGVSVDDFNKKGLSYSHIVSNFDEMTAGWEMKHGAIVQADGSLSLARVESFITSAQEAGITIYGHTLAWHANQNAKYLNSTIAPVVIPPTDGPTWEVISENDFETTDASNYVHNEGAVVSFTADGEGAEGTGRAVQIANSTVRANDWDSQFFFTFPDPTVVGERYMLTMDVRADAAVTFPTQAHTVPYTYKFYDFFGSVSATTEWAAFSKEIVISEDISGVTSIAFNLGATATNYYFDNFQLKKLNETGGGGPALDPSVITDSDFENGVGGWGGWGGASTRGLSADGKGYGDAGFAYTFTNPTVGDFWGAQLAYELSPLENGSTYVLNFQVKASTSGAIRAELQSSADYSSDGIGTFNVSENWTEYTMEAVATKDDRNRFIISFGDYAGTVYIDDVTLRRVNPDGGGEQIIEKTPEEKTALIGGELERWIAGTLEVTKGYVKAWDVVNEPMDDGSPYELKTGIGKSNMAADEFYWQDYLGKDYAVMAFKLARQYGNSTDIHFINDYNLEYNIDKCKGLIAYVEYIESKGAQVDGIGTQMHITVNSDKDKIVEMFTLLAATGKMIKVSELDLGVGVPTSEATDIHYVAQAEMYKFVVEKYFEIIPSEQRYGITVWSPTDSPEGSSWRAGEPIGLWTEGYYRKRAYAGFADGLSGN